MQKFIYSFVFLFFSLQNSLLKAESPTLESGFKVPIEIKAVGECKQFFNRELSQTRKFTEAKKCDFRLSFPKDLILPATLNTIDPTLRIYSGKNKKSITLSRIRLLNDNLTRYNGLGLKIKLNLEPQMLHKIEGYFTIKVNNAAVIINPNISKCEQLSNVFNLELEEAKTCIQNSDCSDSVTGESLNLFGFSCNCDEHLPLNRQADNLLLDMLIEKGLSMSCDFALNLANPNTVSICMCNPQLSQCINNRCIKVN